MSAAHSGYLATKGKRKAKPPTEPPPTDPDDPGPTEPPNDDPGPVEPPEPIDGAALLDDVRSWFTRFIGADDDDLCILALFTVHTHLAEECYTTPRLQLDSIMPECGKTTTCEHLKRLACDAVHFASITSAALLVRILQGRVRTLIVDEADRSLKPDREGVPEMMAVINSGYKLGASRPVLTPVKGGGWDSEEMSTYAAVVLSGNTPNLPDDTRSRIIRILLMPDGSDDLEDTDWEYIEADAEALHGQIAAWADQVRKRVRGLAVELPKGCRARQREKWRPLKRVAVVAGGDWPEIADRLTERGMAEDEADRLDGLRTMPPGMLILKHLYEVWSLAFAGETFVSTSRIVATLIQNYPEYWGAFSPYGKALTDTRFGRMVRQASKVGSTRLGGEPPRGYTRASLEPVWTRLGFEK